MVLLIKTLNFLLFLILLLLLLLLLLLVLFLRKRAYRTGVKSVCIVVLGDIGRSPRMQYHAISFIKEGYFVEIVGYPGSLPFKELLYNSNVTIHYLPFLPNFLYITRVINYVFKCFWQSISLLFVLFIKCKSNFLVLQNPPAIPAMPICWLYCKIIRVKFIIDWHNYAYSIMTLSLGENHFFVKLTKCIESFFGTRTLINFCVTRAMQKDLIKRWNIKAEVLYDKPSEKFKQISLEEKHNLVLKLSKCYSILRGTEEHSTIFTKQTLNGTTVLYEHRPPLIVSSTSWTEDEDFTVLLEALKDYEDACLSNRIKLPNLICIITGIGPLKEFYKAIIEKKNWKHVSIITPWLENEDYPKLLASADLGICLHASSSGLDLPMKIIDMFGCGLPVCAYNFKCLDELVKHNENSLVFNNSKELAEQLKMYFEKFPNNTDQHRKEAYFKKQLYFFQEVRWHNNWVNEVLTRMT